MGKGKKLLFIVACAAVVVAAAFSIRAVLNRQGAPAGEDVIEDQGSIAVFVNKETKSLSSDYVPDDLVVCDVRAVKEATKVERQLRQEAADALKEMFETADKEGMTLYVESGYRSYQHQTATYNSVKKASGEEYADKYVAIPGHSEHQTGLAMDITNIDHMDDAHEHELGTMKEGIWMRDNAHRFGFILRYPEDKVDITGYNYEPWHFRYVGVEMATEIYQNGWALEEYMEGHNP